MIVVNVPNADDSIPFGQTVILTSKGRVRKVNTLNPPSIMSQQD